MNIRSRDAVYGIGVDTGGTFTDAALFDLHEHQIISAINRPTFHHSLERSIVQPLAMAQRIPEQESWIGEENRSQWIISINSNEQDQTIALDPVIAQLQREKGATRLI
jgi:hypothetical protein